MCFDTQFGINQEHFTQKTRELVIDGETKLKLPLFVWQMHDLDGCLVIWFS